MVLKYSFCWANTRIADNELHIFLLQLRPLLRIIRFGNALMRICVTSWTSKIVHPACSRCLSSVKVMDVDKNVRKVFVWSYKWAATFPWPCNFQHFARSVWCIHSFLYRLVCASTSNSIKHFYQNICSIAHCTLLDPIRSCAPVPSDISNQFCASCWALAATAALECKIAIQQLKIGVLGPIVSLSVRNLLDCTL